MTYDPFRKSLFGVDNNADRLVRIDIGTGAGYPGVPIALAEPNCHVTMIDSTKKKADFVDMAALRSSRAGYQTSANCPARWKSGSAA